MGFPFIVRLQLFGLSNHVRKQTKATTTKKKIPGRTCGSEPCREPTPYPSILGTCIRTRTNRLTSARIPIVAWFAWSTCILVADVFYSFYWFYWSGFSLMRLAALFSFFNILPSPLPNGPSHRQLSEPCYRICSFFLLCGANLTWWYKDGLLSRQKIRGAPQPHMRHRAFSFLVSFFSLFGSCALF